jgi:hypothetical protein
MKQTLMQAKLEAARSAIGEAEKDLRRVVRDSAVAPRAQKVEVDEVVRVALSSLGTARAGLAELERSVAQENLEAAKTALSDGERDLDRVIQGMEVAARAEKTWVTGVVEDAFEKLRAAKARLADLEKVIPDDED